MTKVIITAHDPRLLDKLDAIARLDETAAGGISHVALGRRALRRGRGPSDLFATGYEEMHRIAPGCCAYFGDLVLADDWRISTRAGSDSLRLRVALAGSSEYRARGARVADEAASCAFVILPAGAGVTATVSGGTSYRYCGINVTREFLVERIGADPDGDLPPALIGHWRRRETVAGHFPLSRRSIAVARRYFCRAGDGVWRDFEVRSIALDLLRTVLQEWRATSATRMLVTLSESERAKVAAARRLIEADLAAKPTLDGLAAGVGINRNKLHFGFRQLFGCTLHDFRTQLRMRRALELLEAREGSIAEVAESVGFSEPTNFTAAFRKFYGRVPSDVRRTR